MTEDEQKVRAVLTRGDYHVRRRPGGVVAIEVYDNLSLTFEHLQRLSEAFGTRLINFGFEQSTGPYSELTPGDPASFTIEIVLPKGD